MSKTRHGMPRMPFWQAVHAASFDLPHRHVIEPHAHRWHQLLYATEGVMTVETPEGTWVVPAHRAVWVPGLVAHSVAMSGRVSMRTLYVRPTAARRLPSGCRAFTVTPLLRELILEAVRIGRLDRRVESHVRVYGLLFDQLRETSASALHVPTPREPRAARVARILAADPGDRRSLSELARRAGASARTLERIFKAETGLNFQRWRQQLRFVHALKRLAAGAKVTSVALDVGYESPSAFVSAFRRVLGDTPGRYFRATSTES